MGFPRRWGNDSEQAPMEYDHHEYKVQLITGVTYTGHDLRFIVVGANQFASFSSGSLWWHFAYFIWSNAEENW